MKIVIIILVGIVLLIPLENSYGQAAQLQTKATPKIFFQIQLRDKDGNLYGFIQPVLQIFDMDRTIAWVAPHATNSSIVYQGQHYLLMKFQDHFVESHFEQFGGYTLNVPVNGKMTNIFYAYHDSYLMSPGDTGSVFWEILIPSR